MNGILLTHLPRRWRNRDKIACLVVLGLALGQTSRGEGPMESRPLHERIDALVSRQLESRKLIPAKLSSDAEFVRRVYLDLSGVIPTAQEARTFLDDPAPDKRARLIDTLLTAPGYALHMARVFDVMLLERRVPAGGTAVDVPLPAWRDYLSEAFAENRPWDVMTRELLGGDGSDSDRGAAVRFYLTRDVNAHQLTRDVGRLFLGIDLQCAQCHDDPRFKDYRQEDYFGLYAFLERSKLFPVKPKGALLGELAVGTTKFTSVFTAKSGETYPRLPGGALLADPQLEKDREYRVKPGPKERGIPVYSRRVALSEHLPRKETPGFTRNLANRLWALMLGRGIIQPLDLSHAGNPPSHPELLAELEAWLAAHHHDIRGLLREITLSRTYQRSSELPDGSPPPPDAFAVAPLRGLTAEQFRWSLLQATGRIEAHLATLDAQPKKASAAETPAWKQLADRLEPLERPSAALLAAFSGLPGQPEEGFQPTVDQALHLLNSEKLLPLLKADPGTLLHRLSTMEQPEPLIGELYFSVLSRPPDAEEMSEASQQIAAAGSPEERNVVVKALSWGLLLSAEFRLNH